MQPKYVLKEREKSLLLYAAKVGFMRLRYEGHTIYRLNEIKHNLNEN